MNGWQTLIQELDYCYLSGRVVNLWWRDDDADHPSANLEHLVRLSSSYGVPLGLAISPALVQPALPDFIATHNCTVLQHGYAHVNHAPSGEKKCELGEHRPIPVIMRELKDGSAQMRKWFGERYLPVMVPPWNRIADAVAEQLSAAGFTGLSTYTPRGYSFEHGLRRCNTHVDIVNWKAQDAFIGTEAAVALLLDHLTKKRMLMVDTNEATGLLTHHQRHDAQAWQFINELMDHTCTHPAVCWLSPAKLFSEGS